MSTSKVRTIPRVGPSSAGMLMTPEEFDAITRYDDRYRYELIHGVLVVAPIPARGERNLNGYLEYLLRGYQENHPQGSTLDLTLSEEYLQVPDGRRRADRVIWAGLGRVPEEDETPTIAVEFVSKSRRDWRRDYEEKRREYLALGVLEYWVIDRFRRTLTVYRDPARGPAEQVIAEAETYRTPLLPGFELPLAPVLAQADRIPPRKKRTR